jgi:predicted GIY-YIG superfamily endonuclease
MHYVYLLESQPSPSRHYVGSTTDLKSRLTAHNCGKNPSTVSLRPWNLAAYIAIPDEAKAFALEQYLKSGSGKTFAKRHFL